jgi:hypothetical protein
MQGIEISRKFYEEYGKEMIRKKFPEYEDRIAVGIAGNGSDCFGFDDEISRDHDFYPGFIMWVNKEDAEKIDFGLFREYEKLPDEFLGIKREKSSFFGNGKYGVKVIGQFYEEYTGMERKPKTLLEWLRIPEYSLAAATNGEIFRDELGEFTGIREYLINEMPEDVWLKKIASRAVFMAQSGQYNYKRSIEHKEPAAALIALAEFVRNTAEMIHFLNRKHPPFYKWVVKSVKNMNILAEVSDCLEKLSLRGNSNGAVKENLEEIEKISFLVIQELKNQNFSQGNWDYLEPHGYEVMKRIQDNKLKVSHIMEG